MKPLEQEKIIIVMLIFAKDRPHMSGFIVLFFYMLILVDLAMCFMCFNGDDDISNWLKITFGISSLICAIGLIILLNAVKIGGYIALITCVIQFLSAANTSITESAFGEEKWEVLIGLLIAHVLFVSIVLFGSRKHHLI